MAKDSVLKLRVESQEYDAKLKKAAEGIRHLADVAHKAGGDLSGLDKAELDYIRGLGEMETKSRTAAGSLRELEETFKELTVVYNQLNEVEKADEGGKALAASLETLKKRAQEARKELDDASAALKDNEKASKSAGVGVQSLTSALGINVKQFAGWGAAVTAGKVALTVFSDVMMSSRETADDFGRDIQGLQNVYESFLISLNNGDISGFLSRIQEIVGAARSAYDALSDLQEFNAFNRVNVQKARTGLNSAVTDFREGKASKEDVRNANEALKKELRERQQREQAVYDETIKQIAKDYGTNSDDLKKLLAGNYVDWHNQKHSNLQGSGTKFTFTPMASPYVWSGQQAQFGTRNYAATSDERLSVLARTIPLDKLDKLQQLGEQAEATNTEITQLDKSLARLLNRKTSSGGGGGNRNNVNTNVIEYAADSIMAQEKLVQELTQKWKTAGTEMKGGYLEQLNEAKAKLDEMIKGPDLDKLFPDLSAQKYNTGTVSRGDALMQSIRADMGRENMAVDQASLKNIMTMAMKEGLDTSEIDANGLLERIFNGEDIPTDFWNGLMDRLNEALQDFGREAYDLDEKGNLKQRQRPEEKETTVKQDNAILKQLEKFNGDYSKVTGGVSSIASGIQQLGIDIPNEIQSVLGVLTGISSIMTGITSILSLILVAEQVTATTSAVKSIPVIGWALANGGIVPHAANGYFVGGNSYSGDNTPIMANAGELVLNKAQQGNLASQLSGGGMQNLHLETYLDGRAIRIVLNNESQGRLKGKYVTSQNLRG